MLVHDDQALMLLAASLLRSGYDFTTPTPQTHHTVNARPQNSVATSLIGVFGWSRPFAQDALPAEIFTLAIRASALLRDGDLWRSRYRISTLDGLAFLHSAFPTDEPDAVFFGPDTYRFTRAVRGHLARDPTVQFRALDLGCGAGAGATLIARARPAADVTMSDINPLAIRLARINAATAGLGHIQAVQSDLFAALSGSFDLIVANPPYMADTGRRAYRDGGGVMGAGISLRIINESIPRLTAGGTLLLYTGTAIVAGMNPFLKDATDLLTASGCDWQAEEIDPDVFGEELQDGPMAAADRIAVICLTVTKPMQAGPHA